MVDNSGAAITAEDPVLKEFIEGEVIETMKKDKALYDWYFTQTSDLEKNGWKIHTNEPETKIYWKQEEGMAIVSVCFEGLIKSNLLEILPIIGEIQLFEKWAPTIQKAEQLKKVSNFRQLF